MGLIIKQENIDLSFDVAKIVVFEKLLIFFGQWTFTAHRWSRVYDISQI